MINEFKYGQTWNLHLVYHFTIPLMHTEYGRNSEKKDQKNNSEIKTGEKRC